MNWKVEDLLVRKSLLVQAPLDHVFDVFTQRMDLWWPRSHHIGKAADFTACLETHAGGRWYERGADGGECDWGRVLQWDPPHRLVLSWDINAQWQYDPSIANEVEVLFHPVDSNCTRVELEHRKIERYADQAAAMLAVFDSEGGWTSTLKSFAKVAEQSSRVPT